MAQVVDSIHVSSTGSAAWQQISIPHDSICQAALKAGVNVIFTKSEPILQDVTAMEKWSKELGIPQTFWSETCFRLNGFLGSSIRPYSNKNNGKRLQRYDSWFRLIIKTLSQQEGPSEYEWLEMSFFSRWTEETNLLICFDVPEELLDNFAACLRDQYATSSTVPLGPFALHTVLMSLVVPIYDQSIWDLAKRIRTIEKNREHMTDTDFPGLHEVARHTAHATETVQVAVDIVARMASQCKVLAERQEKDIKTQATLAQRQEIEAKAEATYAQHETLEFQHSMIFGIAARSASNEKRLTNEINLVFNMMAQKDNDVNMQIARATRIDSSAMKTIALVTLTFLPATYISALLGMNLFSFDPESNGGHIAYSPDLWIYFVISVPLTVVILGFWYVWQRREDMAERLESAAVEKALKGKHGGSSASSLSSK